MRWVVIYIVGLVVSLVVLTPLWRLNERKEWHRGGADYNRGKIGVLLLWPLTITYLIISSLGDWLDEKENLSRRSDWNNKIRGGK